LKWNEVQVIFPGVIYCIRVCFEFELGQVRCFFESERWERKLLVQYISLFVCLFVLVSYFVLVRFAFTRDGVSRCPSCVTEEGCGYCLSTLQCATGGLSGPTVGTSCTDWVIEKRECPSKYCSESLETLNLIATGACESQTSLRFYHGVHPLCCKGRVWLVRNSHMD
jgi:hypothetical protein